MLIRDLFQRDVTRDIPPVVYFHQQQPQQVAVEVSEYIITGGLPAGHPRARQLKDGIHEQYVKLLRGIAAEQRKPTGPELPACWISGFYGSGKSIFAKLLGLSLDHLALPDGKSLAAALLDRDDSARNREFRDAWRDLGVAVDSIAVVFDIGAVARDREHIHNAVLRRVQARLGYCTQSRLVADYELRLEIDGRWEAFVHQAEQTLGKSWAIAREERLAEDHFSHVLHVLEPNRYIDPMSWIDARAGTALGRGQSVGEVVGAIDAMLAQRAPGKTLFIVVDEVSQYVHEDGSKMLKLQSFVSELGQKLHGAAWLLATGQQKLEDETQSTNLGKLKDRFPERLRVHLATTNIRDVVHKRLLRKRDEHTAALRKLFQDNRLDLQLHAYGCEAITEEDFVEVYPLLPGYVDLILDLTTALRRTSNRTQGDDYAVRGLLQLLGELFREKRLAARDVGALVALDAIYDILATAFDADRRESMRRVTAWCTSDSDADGLCLRAAKAVSLLQLVQERSPTSQQLVARCLYDAVGRGSQLREVKAALERLRDAGHLSYSEKYGYKLQSSAGQDWDRARRDIPVVADDVTAGVRQALAHLMAGPNQPRHGGTPFAWTLMFSDGRSIRDERIQGRANVPSLTVDLRLLSAEERQPDLWLRRSKEEAYENRLIWIAAGESEIQEKGHALHRSREMIRRNEPRRASMSLERRRLLLDEQARSEELEKAFHSAVAHAWQQGRMYFRGRALIPRDHGAAFATSIERVATAVLEELYPHFVSIPVTDKELKQLLAKEIRAPSSKFLGNGLGILSQDAGRFVPTCEGEVPQRVLQFVEKGGCSGKAMFARFLEPPYGYPPDMIRACVAGLLRARKVTIHPERGQKVTSVRDPDVEALIVQDRPLRTAQIVTATDEGLTFRDRNRICRFFKQRVGIDVETDDDAIADAVHTHFSDLRRDLTDVETRLRRLPGQIEPPQALRKFATALEDGKKYRQVDDTLRAVKRHLDALGDGVHLLQVFKSELTDAAIEAVQHAANVQAHQLSQLTEAGADADLEEPSKRVAEQLRKERPWREIGSVRDDVVAVVSAYEAERAALLGEHEAAVEAARRKLRARPGFEKLTGDQRNHVLRPIHEAQFNTTAQAVAPTVVEMRERFPTRLQDAVELANDRLDKLLDTENETTVVRVATNLRGREVATLEQLDAALGGVRERAAKEIDAGRRVRLS